MRNQNVYPYWLRLSFLRKRVVARCHFERAPSFPTHNFYLLETYGLVTSQSPITLYFLTPHFFLGLFGSFILISV